MKARIVAEGPGGILELQRERFADARGSVSELWRDEWQTEAGLPRFVQHNVLHCQPGALRGLHVQTPRAQAKLVSVLEGRVFDVGVDVRRGSPTFGAVYAVGLDAHDARSVFLPSGFAHGVVALDAPAIVVYQASEYHDPAGDLSIRWDDPDLAIDWPVRTPILSDRDRAAPFLKQIAPGRLPGY